eukprot:3618078-Rhodomonas_salina.9
MVSLLAGDLRATVKGQTNGLTIRSVYCFKPTRTVLPSRYKTLAMRLRVAPVLTWGVGQCASRIGLRRMLVPADTTQVELLLPQYGVVPGTLSAYASTSPHAGTNTAAGAVQAVLNRVRVRDTGTNSSAWYCIGGDSVMESSVEPVLLTVSYPIRLRASYALSGTNLAYNATGISDAVSGTDQAYGPTDPREWEPG